MNVMDDISSEIKWTYYKVYYIYYGRIIRCVIYIMDVL